MDQTTNLKIYSVTVTEIDHLVKPLTAAWNASNNWHLQGKKNLEYMVFIKASHHKTNW